MRFSWGSLILLACSGCSSILGIDNFKLGDAATNADADPEGIAIDTPAGCLGAGSFTVCGLAPSMPVNLDGMTGGIETSTSTLCAPTQPGAWASAGQPAACFIVGTRIVISAPIRFSGLRPLVLVATDEITITLAGGIDAAGHRLGIRAPGGPASVCVLPQPAMDGPGNTAGGGGAGGSFMMPGGGPGGFGEGGQNLGGSPGAIVSMTPTLLRAGCDGGFGGRTGGSINPPGGFAGGAVFLVAGSRITNDGFINVSGSGGEAGPIRTGGGGAASGGMLVMYASTIVGSGFINANGGGGAGGSNPLQSGTSGQDPTATQPFQPANGGGGAGSPGGSGSAETAAGGVQPPQPGGDGGFSGGGGGGGGGAGYVRANVTPTLTMAISPHATIVP